MTKLYLIAGTIIAFAIVMKILVEHSFVDEKKKPQYRYTLKSFFMSRAEREFFNTLVLAAGNEYHIFPQVHIATVLDEKVKGQDWRAARSKIDKKSVDFVLCDKVYLSPKLAIELDDKSHEREDRQERDGFVELILKDAGLPLLRIQNAGAFDAVVLAAQIKTALVPKNEVAAV